MSKAMPEVNGHLCSLDAWDTFSLVKSDLGIKINLNFNAWDLTCDNLVGVASALFARLGLIQHLKISEREFMLFVKAVEAGYLSNPYHSFHHAVDVCVVIFFTLIDLGLGARLSTEDILALMLAGLCHDIGHPGVNNMYQVNAKTELAEAFNGVSVLENYSCQLTKNILEKHRLLRNSETDVEECVMEYILATDMAFHFSKVEELNQLLLEWPQEGQVPRKSRRQLCGTILHAADISNAVRPWPLCKAWSDMVINEFFQQGDLERRNDLPVSPNMDRGCSSQAQIALDFDAYIITPFFEALASLFPDSKVFLQHLHSNRKRWTVLNRKLSALPSPLLPIRRVSFSAGTVIIPESFREDTKSSPNNSLPRGARHRRRPNSLRRDGCPTDKVRPFSFIARIPSTDSLEHPVLS
ncbi:hypothetical protein DSO57_1035896 [Entomophthora muscae]|uniref:Uncharacterized protein n=1 Tax=Entomophthora muscae TaxID=34485 RepID=A0ACC2SNC0_9FUNG|nr:hypothetical protein DSO57_1035896 [Entomophthora muscae]